MDLVSSKVSFFCKRKAKKNFLSHIKYQDIKEKLKHKKI